MDKSFSVSAPARKGVIFMRKNNNVNKLVRCALLLAIALVLKNFSYMVYIGGGGGMRIGVSGFFTRLAAVLFGPGCGAAVSALNDIIGTVIKPDGAYIFPLTLTAAAGGAIAGAMFRAVEGVNTATVKKIYLAFSAAIGILGVFIHINAAFIPDGTVGAWISGFGKKSGYFTYGAYVICALGLIFYLINAVIEKKSQKPFAENYLKMFITFFIADVPVTTANTFILMAFIPALGKLPFWSFYLPRLAQEILSVFVSSYFVAYLKWVCARHKLNE